MAESKLERELKLIRQRLESIEEALGEEMTSDDKQALEDALEEHREGKTQILIIRIKHICPPRGCF